jgi:hypothetical protein
VNISRQDLAAIIERFAEYKELRLKQERAADTFADAAAISEAGLPPSKQAVRASIISAAITSAFILVLACCIFLFFQVN